jgi:hypothetical protein
MSQYLAVINGILSRQRQLVNDTAMVEATMATRQGRNIARLTMVTVVSFNLSQT